ncbi:MAG: DUF5698 domain-containing protein [Firmicutes bacterium]|nr:DUF5698 domain-containing protein [Bacillota bacterium]
MPILTGFFSVPNWWLLVFIFLAQIAQVTIGTVEVILINKGYRKSGTVLSLVEILLWVFVASRVLGDITVYPLEGITYALGYTAGVYVGSVLEQKLAFGKVLIQTITTVEKGPILATQLRGLGCGVTVVDASGKVESRKILMVIANRRGSEKITEQIKRTDPAAMIIQNEVGGVVGGHLSRIKSLIK